MRCNCDNTSIERYQKIGRTLGKSYARLDDEVPYGEYSFSHRRQMLRGFFSEELRLAGLI